MEVPNSPATGLGSAPEWTVTNGSDLGWIGLKNEGGDLNHLTLAWADNTMVDGPDLLKFIFLANNNAANGTAGTVDGLEAARIRPAAGGNESFFGIGDWFTTGLNTNPTERLDVLDGKVRIRQLPTDPVSTSNQFVTVNPVTGVLERRPVTLNALTACEWTLLGAPGSNSNIATAYNGNPGCPQGDKRVGIGTNSPLYKLDVAHTEADGSISGGLRVNLLTNSGGWRNGVHSTVRPMPSGADLLFATSLQGNLYDVGSTTEGILADSYAVYGRSATEKNVYLRNSHGVAGEAYSTMGTVASLNAGHFEARNVGGTVAKCYGVYGSSRQYTGTMAEAYGVYGLASGAASNFGVYGTATGGTTNWSGYFVGNTYVAGTVFTPSDEQLKTNIEDMTNATEQLLMLSPKTYRYKTEEYPNMGFAVGTRFGFIAQEVGEHFPQLVTAVHQPLETDSAGVVINSEMDFMGLSTMEMIPLLVAGFKEQQTLIADLRQQIEGCCAAQGQGMAPNNGDQRNAPEEELKEQRLLIIPNPVADLTTLRYYVPQAGQVSLQVSSADGKPLETLREEKAEEGEFNYTWNTTQLAAGTYFCTLMMDGNVVVKRAVKVK